MSELYIGLMSGTSLDGIDVALVELSGAQPKMIASLYQEYSPSMRQEIETLCQPGQDEINRLGHLDAKLGRLYGKTINILLKNNAIKSDAIIAIGSHGQTVRHHPTQLFTLQIGDPNIIAAETGITTIADFRRRDLAYGGQGAPLVPAFHKTIFHNNKFNRIIVNIGGMANITLLPAEGEVSGYDTGPGNVLLNMWATEHLKRPYDENGDWAAQGKVNVVLLKKLLSDPYFKLAPPKSTGREYFNLTWLQNYLSEPISPIDIQATLIELTACSILNAIELTEGEILICGGGVKNKFLLERLKALGKNFTIDSTAKYHVDPNWVEAIAFAWLAKQTLNRMPGNLPSVTGANRATILGAIYPV